MSPTGYEIAWIAGGFTIIGAILGALATYRLSMNLTQRTHDNAIDLMQRQEFNKAAAFFRTTFTDEYRELKGIFYYAERFSEDDVLKMLNSSRTKFENACTNFRVHIDKSKRVGFDNAWKEYCHPQGCDPQQVPSAFTEYFIDKEFHESISRIIRNIENLLSFAEPK